MDAKGDLAALFEAAPTDFTPREIAPGIWSMSMDTEASLREYLKLHLRIPVVGRIGPLAKAFDFVATAAPGVREILDRRQALLRGPRAPLRPGGGRRAGERPHHRPAGRTPGHQRPGQGGPHPQPDRLDARDPLGPRQTGLVAVRTPEEMPVSETLELVTRVKEETTVQMSAVVVNRVLPELFGQREEEIFEQLRAARHRRASSRSAPAARWPRCSRPPGWPSPCAAPASVHLQRLQAGLPEGCPVLLLPYLFTRSHGTAHDPPGRPLAGRGARAL